MKNLLRLESKLKDQRGVTAIVVAILMTMLIGFVALAVDIGYVMVTKNELQNVADASSLAAARQLGFIYEGMSYEEQQAYVCDPSTIKPIAVEVAAKNQAGGKSVIVNMADVVIGQWDGSSLTATLAQPDAVKVTARREEGSHNGPITTFFARIFGVDTVDVSADAIAALTGQSTSGLGGLELPVGISQYRFDTGFCNQPIRFYPTGDDSCAGWNAFLESQASASLLKDLILPGIEDGTYVVPETASGETELEFIGGNIASAFPALESLFMAKSTETSIPLYISPAGELVEQGDVGYEDAEPILDKDGNQKYKREWTTLVVVYESDDCSNPGGAIKITGYATITMVAVNGSVVSPSSAKFTIFGEIDCGSFSTGRSGGGPYGTKGTIPGLVE